MSPRARLLGLALAASALAACNPGAYPIDKFPEMHYAPWHRPLEPERRSAPDGAVPAATGSRPWPAGARGGGSASLRIGFEQAAELENPVSAAPERLEEARGLYRVNCQACHGADGRGQTYVGERLLRVGAEPPTDFSSARVRERTDGELHWLIGRGIGGMPPFGELLSDEQRWLTVLVVRELGGG